MDPFSLQKQVKDNASDLQDFCKDLKAWREEMDVKNNPTKAKEEESRAKIKKLKAEIVTKAKNQKVEKNETKTDKLPKVTDYSTWDKYDVEGECARLDMDSSNESDISDEIDETKMNLAKEEKEKGNKYVKLQKWDDAITCYTKAIDVYAYDPVFYANRALCLLKQSDYKKAEADCTIALKLDSTYVKAYHRRAIARENQNFLTEAHDDLLKVLELEPNNKESQAAIDLLEKRLGNIKKPTEETPRPISKFTQSRQKLTNSSLKHAPHINETAEPVKKHVYERKQPETEQPKLEIKPHVWPEHEDIIEIIKPISKPPNLRSKKPLKRVTITDSYLLPVQIKALPDTSHKNETEKSVAKSTVIEETKEYETDLNKINFVVPKTAIQFYNIWKSLKGTKPKLKYLLQIDPNNFGQIFKESLDSKVFSNVIQVLVDAFKSQETSAVCIHEHLLGLTRVKRFSALVMFMSLEDKENMVQLMEEIKNSLNVSNDEVNQLKQKYGL